MTHLPHPRTRRTACLVAATALALGLAGPALAAPTSAGPAPAAPVTAAAVAHQGSAGSQAADQVRPATTTATADPQDPALDQTVSAEESVGQGPAVIDVGHVDLGPRYVDGQWKVMLRDDSGSAPVWRDPGEVVLRVRDAALLPAPTDEAYAFMAAEEGQQWYVIPQTQDPDVVWLGWNTQDPGVVSAVDRGVTMTIGPVQGPGRSWMFTQSGTFGEPLLLVDGQNHSPQDVWVDANTHVHANWVFTDPGVYTARLAFTATTAQGDELTGSTVLRFAVGDATSTDEALAAPAPTAEGGAPSQASAEGGVQAEGTGAEEAAANDKALSARLLWLGGAAALIVLGVLGALLARRSRAVAREQREARDWADAQDSLATEAGSGAGPGTDAEPGPGADTEEDRRDGRE